MNGHIQLSISLKNVPEIMNAIYLLHSLLPKPPEITVRPATEHPSIPHEQYEKWEKEPTPYAVAEGDILKLKTAKIKLPKLKQLPNDKIIENLMRGAPKAPPVPKYDRVYRDADGKVKVHKGRDRTMREKFRQNALKRKRDKSGHFLPTKK